MDMVRPKRFDIYLVSLDPTLGEEIRETRPCIVVSPDEANRHLQTVVVTPLTTTMRKYPSRLPVRFRGRNGEAALDQVRAVDVQRLVRRLGMLSPDAARRITSTLLEFFAE
jgi:mRNA interferase MazF